MTGASIETTLELWATSLRDVKARMRGLFTQERVAASAGLFLEDCRATSGARLAGCVRKRQAIRDRGGSRRSSAAVGGTLTRCVISYATMSSRRWLPRMRCS